MLQSETDLAAVPDTLLPGILKTARLGYDGRGQLRVRTRDELANAWASLKGVPCVLEQLLDLQSELSVVVARGWDGVMVHYPAQANVHRDGILAITSAHAGNLPPALGDSAVAATRAIAEGLNYVGVLCVEFFVLQDGSLIVNEMAPAHTTAATTHWTPAMSRSSSSRCAPWPACP